MKRAVFGPPIPGDSRWQTPYGGLQLSVAAAAWRRDQWLVTRGPAALGPARPALPSALLAYGEPPPHGVRRLLRGLGLRPGTPVLVGVQSRRARRGYWDVLLVYAVPVMGRTRATRHAIEPDFRDPGDPATASAFRAAGIDLALVERLTAMEQRRSRRAKVARENGPGAGHESGHGVEHEIGHGAEGNPRPCP